VPAQSGAITAEATTSQPRTRVAPPAGPEGQDALSVEGLFLSFGGFQAEQARAFRLLDQELDHYDDEVTATMKVRRKTIHQELGPLVREIHGDAAEGREAGR